MEDVEMHHDPVPSEQAAGMSSGEAHVNYRTDLNRSPFEHVLGMSSGEANVYSSRELILTGMSRGEANVNSSRELKLSGMSSGEANVNSLRELKPSRMSSGEANFNSSREFKVGMSSGEAKFISGMSSGEAKVNSFTEFKFSRPEGQARGEPFLSPGGLALGSSMRTSVATSDSFPTIYKVPQRIRQGNKYAFEPYEPQIVSIGPYHHHKDSLKEFEKHKIRYRDSILSHNRDRLLQEIRKKIQDLKDEVQSCYSDNASPWMGNDQFVEMMVLDGCFIVELFLKFKHKKEQSEVDQIFGPIWLLPLIRYDMLLLENQIPFRVLKIIYEMVCPGKGSLVKLALDFFEHITPRNKKIQIKDSDYQNKDSYYHLLHLFHSRLIPTPRKNKWKKLLEFLGSEGFLPCSKKAKLPISNNPSPPSSPDKEPIKMIPCAADLQLAGVKFKRKKDFSGILDVEFSHGVLEIPPLLIEDYTNTLFRNLVAFEQCCYPRATICFTTYLRFMDCLVNTSKDVALLHDNGILDHLLGSDEDVARLFNQLCYGMFDMDDNYLSGLFEKVHEHYNTPWNKWWASFRRDYCSNPCVGLSSIAAVILIAVTIIQTIYTVYPYYRQYS